MAMRTLKELLKRPEESRVDINAMVSNLADRRHDTLYDRVRLKAGTITPHLITCFQVPVAQFDPFDSKHIRTYVDTNMLQSGMLPPPHDMLVRRVIHLFQPSCSETARNSFLASYQWDLRVMEKVFSREPALVSAAVGTPDMVIENFGKGSWLNDKGDRADDSASKMESLGRGVAWDLLDVEDYRKYLPPMMYFAVELRGQPFELPGDLDFYVMLDGLRDWPVR